MKKRNGAKKARKSAGGSKGEGKANDSSGIDGFFRMVDQEIEDAKKALNERFKAN